VGADPARGVHAAEDLEIHPRALVGPHREDRALVDLVLDAAARDRPVLAGGEAQLALAIGGEQHLYGAPADEAVPQIRVARVFSVDREDGELGRGRQPRFVHDAERDGAGGAGRER
ncbi:MAG: hypothetical protein ACK56F_12650, partial [bacterium]